MTKDQLLACSKKELAQHARDLGITGWHSMRKEELLANLMEKRRRIKVPAEDKPAPAKSSSKSSSTPRNSDRASAKSPAPKSRPKTQRAAARDTSTSEELIESSKFEVGSPTRDLSARVPRDLPNGYGKDKIVVMVRDPYWLHAYWELTHHSIQRAEAKFGPDWPGAKPILRIYDVSAQDTTSTSETHLRDIEIHGGCNNWYVEVSDPPRSFRVDIGYISQRGQFFRLAHSNKVTTPRAGISDSMDENFTDVDEVQAERILAMSTGFDPASSPGSLEIKELFEERLRRPMGSPSVTSFGSGALLPEDQRSFWFKLNAELIVYGATEPDARVTLQGEPVRLREDGTFTMRFSLPDGRQIIPATAASSDGVEERTIVLAVERNTKELEPILHNMDE